MLELRLDRLRGVGLKEDVARAFGMTLANTITVLEGKEMFDMKTGFVASDEISNKEHHLALSYKIRDILTSQEVDSDLYGDILSYMNSKRWVEIVYTDSGTPEKRYLSLPINVDKIPSNRLDNAVWNLWKVATDMWQIAKDKDTRRQLENQFKLGGINQYEYSKKVKELMGEESLLKSIYFIQKRNSERLFSKEFKHNYGEINGYIATNVPADCGYDEILLPAKTCRGMNVEIGDIVLCYRHPIQNMFLALRVAGHCENDIIRFHSRVGEHMIGNDHDGDQMFVVKPEQLGIKEDDCYALLPSWFMSKFNIETPQYKESGATLTFDKLFDDSTKCHSKNSKYNASVGAEDYIHNYSQTVLNLRATNEGTGIAGAFVKSLFLYAVQAGLDLQETRMLCDMIQQASLDSKHNTGDYRDEAWYKLASFESTRRESGSAPTFSNDRDALAFLMSLGIEPNMSAVGSDIDFGVEEEERNEELELLSALSF